MIAMPQHAAPDPFRTLYEFYFFETYQVTFVFFRISFGNHIVIVDIALNPAYSLR